MRWTYILHAKRLPTSRVSVSEIAENKKQKIEQSRSRNDAFAYDCKYHREKSISRAFIHSNQIRTKWVDVELDNAICCNSLANLFWKGDRPHALQSFSIVGKPNQFANWVFHFEICNSFAINQFASFVVFFYDPITNNQRLCVSLQICNLIMPFWKVMIARPTTTTWNQKQIALPI